MPPLRKLVKELARVRPDLDDPEDAIASGLVQVDGVVVRNPASMVRVGTSIVVRSRLTTRGSCRSEPSSCPKPTSTA
jgi:hypothetical protein